MYTCFNFLQHTEKEGSGSVLTGNDKYNYSYCCYVGQRQEIINAVCHMMVMAS